MADIIDLKDFWDEPDVEEMDREELRAYLKELQARVAELDAKEPRNMNSAAYEAWADQHEELEDLMDEVLDRLDEFE